MSETVSIANMSDEERLRLRLHVESQQDGANPSQMLELLASATENKIWENLEDKGGDHLEFIDFIERPYPVGIGMTRDDVRRLIGFKHRYEREGQIDKPTQQRMDIMRRIVLDLLNPELAEHGGDRANTASCDSQLANGSQGSGNRDYTLRRLKRDNPELAEKVLDGEMSANAAAIEAGFRKKRVSVAVEAESAACSILKHFPEDEVVELIEILAKELE